MMIKRISIVFLLSAMSLSCCNKQPEATQVQTIEITKDNPTTLIGLNSKDFRVMGFKMGMTRNEVNEAAVANNNLAALFDDNFPNYILVCKSGTLNDENPVIYFEMRWDDGDELASGIDISEVMRPMLSPSFSRLFDLNLFDQTDFLSSFLGMPDDSSVYEDPYVDSKITARYYNSIGVILRRSRIADIESASFSLSISSP